MPQNNPYILPPHVEPVHYEIQLQPRLDRFIFSGSETITVAVRKPTTQIVLHALELRITKAELRPASASEPLPARRMTANRKKETLTLEFGKTLKRGVAKLYLEFEGELNDKMHGFYRTSYFVKGAKRWGAATQFEATDARRAFPCWDEPARKATFSVTLTVPEHLKALSNMPVRRETRPQPGWKTLRFQKTPRMSTYLLAVVVAELECLEGKDGKGVPVRVWTSPGKKNQGRFALQQACHTLAYFAEWFGIPYAFPKLDMVALPDFAAGAMENWGLVTYRETALLIDPKNSAASARQRVAEVVDHELAHQWFGNYTPMQWWTDLWLNEGFASYMGPKATDHRFPGWDTWTQYVAENYLSALHEDSLRSTHPVEVPVRNPHAIRQAFDATSYSKGSVINRMLEHYLGEKNFQKGLNRYLKQHAYGNATTDDLWEALEKTSGKPVRRMMASYTRRPGYPVLQVKERRENGNLLLELEQQRFLADGSQDQDSRKSSWQIPVGVLTAGQPQPSYEFIKGQRHRLRLAVSDQEWVKLNPGQAGFYRVAYSERLWKAFIPAIEKGELPTVDRLGLLDDAFALARAGYLKTPAALDLLKAFQQEKDFSVWLALAGIFSALDNLLHRERFWNRFQTLAQEFFQPIAARMGWERRPSDGHLDVLLRAVAVRNLGGYGHQPTVEEARRRFARFHKTGQLDPDLRQPVYSLVAENGGETEWKHLRKMYHSTDLHEEKLRVLRAMGNFRQRSVLEMLLQFSLSENVRSQDTPIALASAASHPLGRTLAWNFTKKNWSTLVNRYHGGGLNLLSRIIGITAGFHTREQWADVRDFFRTRRIPGTERAVKKSLEILRSNVAWLERDRADLKRYF